MVVYFSCYYNMNQMNNLYKLLSLQNCWFPTGNISWSSSSASLSSFISSSFSSSYPVGLLGYLLYNILRTIILFSGVQPVGFKMLSLILLVMISFWDSNSWSFWNAFLTSMLWTDLQLLFFSSKWHGYPKAQNLHIMSYLLSSRGTERQLFGLMASSYSNSSLLTLSPPLDWMAIRIS